MHGLELNLMKTLWKYAFGDRMTDGDRELVAGYLLSIGLHLDIKSKGKRDPQQKVFSAAQCDEFVLGTDYYKKFKSPGLVKNVLAICEISFDKHSVAASLAAVEVAPPPAKKAKASSRKDRHSAPVQGGHGAAEVAAAGVDPTNTSHLSLDDLNGEGDREAVLSYIRQKYGNHSSVVIQILTAWEAYGNLFSEWRASWDDDDGSDAYSAKRSLRLARTARNFQAALTCLSNYKQKSWYTHMLVWVVWQQVWLYGNLWPLSTISIESRNARIKRYGLRFTSWRPHVTGTTSTTYSYVDRRSGKHITAERKYESSAVHQISQRLALVEKSWHTSHRFTLPDKLRLMIQSRSTLIKVEVADAPPSLPPATMLSELTSKV
jgi:hypothetical protein